MLEDDIGFNISRGANKRVEKELLEKGPDECPVAFCKKKANAIDLSKGTAHDVGLDTVRTIWRNKAEHFAKTLGIPLHQPGEAW